MEISRFTITHLNPDYNKEKFVGYARVTIKLYEDCYIQIGAIRVSNDPEENKFDTGKYVISFPRSLSNSGREVPVASLHGATPEHTHKLYDQVTKHVPQAIEDYKIKKGIDSQ